MSMATPEPSRPNLWQASASRQCKRTQHIVSRDVIWIYLPGTTCQLEQLLIQDDEKALGENRTGKAHTTSELEASGYTDQRLGTVQWRTAM